MFRQIYEGEKTAACVFRSRKTGIWCRSFLSAVEHGTGEGQISYIGITEDITKEKNAELDAAAGEEIGDAAALEIEERGGGLISVTCRYDDKESDSILLYVRSGQEGLS